MEELTVNVRMTIAGERNFFLLCEDCKGQYRTIDYGKKCPYCHSEHTYLLKGNEFNIKEIGIYEDSGT